MSGPRTIKVFIASPNDLAIERRAFKNVVDQLNSGFGRGADVEFEPLGWEDALAQVGRRPQSAINDDIDVCDVFILVMWRRWGQEAPDARPYSSYTEEEFYRALARFEQTGAPTMFVFFKSIDPGQIADPGKQLEKILAFRSKLEATRRVLYRTFEAPADFEREIDTHLVAVAKGESRPPSPSLVPVVPESVIRELERHKKEAEAALALAEDARTQAKDTQTRAAATVAIAERKVIEQAIDFANVAAKAALRGNIEEARQWFAKSIDGTTNLYVIGLATTFFMRTGELVQAEQLVQRWLAITGAESVSAPTAEALSRMGSIHRTRSEFAAAERAHKRALTINEQLGDRGGVAREQGHIGNVRMSLDDLAGAEDMYKKAVESHLALGDKAGAARFQLNLGSVLRARGDLVNAERIYREVLSTEEELAQDEGIASAVGNLGVLLTNRGDLDGAETMFRRSLAIEEKLGRLAGVAADCTNLGTVLRMRGDLDGAEIMFQRSLAIETKLGRLDGIAKDQGNLGVVMLARGKLDEAEALLRQALAIDERLGRPGSVALSCGNLGLVLRGRGDDAGAEAFFCRSVLLQEALGETEVLGNGYYNLGSLKLRAGNLPGAIELWTRAHGIFVRLGWESRAIEIRAAIDSLSVEAPADTRS